MARREAEMEALIAAQGRARRRLPSADGDSDEVEVRRGGIGQQEAIQIVESSARRNRGLITEVETLMGQVRLCPLIGNVNHVC